MQEFKLQPADILINVSRGNDPWSMVKRWAVGPYSHVFLYIGHVGLYAYMRQGRVARFPMLFESNGRGAVIQSLSNRYGQEVVVMRLKPRLKSEFDTRIPNVLVQSIALASDPQAYYDYLCIVSHVLPRIICEKLRLPIPLSWQRDERQICSEAVLEVFLRAKVPVLPKDKVPLPGDFTDSPLLEEVWAGNLSAEII